MGRRLIALSLLLAGAVAMVLVSGWAPAQPELLPTGGACQVAPCGTLEDPPRWRAAWWLWAAGLAAVTVAAVALTPPIRRVPRWHLLVGPLAATAWLLAVVPVALVVSWLTSAHGGATVVACCVVVPVVAAAAGLVKAHEDG